MHISYFLARFSFSKGRTEKSLKFVPSSLKMLTVFILFFGGELCNACLLLSLSVFLSVVSCLLMQANLGFLKVLVAKSPAEGLQIHLRSMVEGLLKWQNDTKNHFKAKVCFSFLSAS